MSETYPARGPVQAYRDLFSNRNYSIYITANSVSLIGLWLQRLGIQVLMWEITGSGWWLGALAFVDMAPAMLLGPFAGVIADRVDRRRIIVTTSFVAAIQASALAVLALIENGLTAPVLLALTAFGGIVHAFGQPARLALPPALVRPRDLTAALAFNSVTFNSARSVGPLIGGATIYYFGYSPAFGFNALSYIVMVFALLSLQLPEQEGLGKAKNRFLKDVWDGLRYSATHVAIGPILAISVIAAVLARPFLELLPGFADRIFDMGVDGVAILTSAAGIGAVISGAWLAGRGKVTGLTDIALINLIAAGASAILFVATGNFYVGVLAIALLSFLVSTCGTATQTLVQTAVDDNMRGRVLSIWGLIFRGAPFIGAWILGALADYFGFVGPSIWIGLACAGATGLAWRWRGLLVRLIERPTLESRDV